jgi:hypothetical protein
MIAGNRMSDDPDTLTGSQSARRKSANPQKTPPPQKRKSKKRLYPG